MSMNIEAGIMAVPVGDFLAYCAPVVGITDPVHFANEVRRIALEDWKGLKNTRLRYHVIARMPGTTEYLSTMIIPSKVGPNTTSSMVPFIRHLIKELEAEAVIAMSEAWTLDKETRETLGNNKDWADVEGRGEILSFVFEQKGKPPEAWAARIHRDPDRIDDFRCMGSHWSGHMFHWFDAPGVN